MAFRTISVVLSANARSLNQAMYQAARSVSFFSESVEGKGVRSLIKFGAVATATTLGAFALERGLVSAVTAAVEFDAAMRNVNSISHLSEQQFANLRGEVLQLSTRLPQSATNLAQGLYDIASSGFQGAAGIKVLSASAEAATAGLSTTATAAQAITATLNAYGESADQARNVSDSLFQTVNVGVVTFDQLAGTLGEVVGTAAQTGVDINQVGSAIATMTLSGIDAAESGTALNRVLQELISPSTAMATLFKQLGYESGVTALKSKGLRGVMEDIRRATGGNIETIHQLFPDIRGLKGALALLSNEGRNYARVAAQIENANNRQGATHRALAEQMKSVQLQWDLFRNRIAAVSIETATHALPALIALMQTMTRLGHDAMPAIITGAHDLAPFFHSIAQIGGDLLHVFAQLITAVGPLAAALAAIGAEGSIQALNGLAVALAAIVDFLTTNRVGMVATAAVLTTLLIPRIIALGVALRQATYSALAEAITGIATAAEGAFGGVVALRAALLSLASAEGVAALALTVGVVALVEEFTAVSTASRDAKAHADDLGSTFNALRPQSAGTQAALSALNSEIDAGRRQVDHYKNAWSILKGALQNVTPFTKNTIQGNVSQLNADLAERARLLDQYSTATKRVNQVAVDLRIPLVTSDLAHDSQQLIALQNLAAHLGLEDALAGPPEKATPAIVKLKAAWLDFSAQTGVSTGQFVHNVGTVDIAALQKLDKAIGEVKKNVAKAFTDANDVIANFHPDQAASDLSSALQSLNSARSSLGDLANRTGKAAASASELAAAHERVAKAQDAVNKAQAAGSLSGFYAKQIRDSRQFLTNIEDATRRGLDPGFIVRLLEAGPEQAGPLLDEIVSAHGDRMVRLVDRSEHALAQISRRAVELARLTSVAMTSATDRQARDLARAQRIALETMAEGSKATIASVAAALHIPEAAVRRIVTEFGITLREVQRTADANPIHLRILTPHIGNAPAGGPVAKLAAGGTVTGPGTATSDSVPAWLSSGEYVTRAAAVAYYGRGVFDSLNKMALPRFATGGYVPPYPKQAAAAPQIIVRGGAGTTVTNQRSVTVGTVVAHDYGDFIEQMDRDARYAAVVGGVR